MSDDFISVDDAALTLQVSRATIWKWIKRHEIETFRMLGERRTLLRRGDIEKLREPVPIETIKKLAA